MEAAAVWRGRKAEGINAADAAAFDAWMAEPDNAEAFAQIERAWAAFETPDSFELRSLLRQTRQRARRYRHNRTIIRIAAGFVLAIGLGMAGLTQLGDIYANADRQPKVITLTDGSRLTLDAASSVRVRYTRSQRHFELKKGHASFQVAHLPSRPFNVKVGEASVVALGTTFDIDRWGESATITLLEGGVRVTSPKTAPVTLGPGQQVTLHGDTLSAVAAVSPQTVSAWRSGVLIFDDVRLGKALADVSRYNARQVSLADPALAELRISGVFRADEPDAFYKSVAELHGLRATQGPNGLTLRRRN
jgi:transmembrane sensor